MIPTLTALQMKQVDDLAVENGLLVMQMMEQAALQMSRLVLQLYPDKKRVLVIAGTGHNGGDGIAAARFLQNWGYEPEVALTSSPDQLKEVSLHHLKLIEKMGIPVYQSVSDKVFNRAEVAIDAMLGYAIDGDPREPVATLINQLNTSNLPIIAFDNPSGLDVTTGKPYNPCIKAAATLTLALPKTGLLEESAKKYVGELYLADLGIPGFVFELVGIKIHKDLFLTNSLIRV